MVERLRLAIAVVLVDAAVFVARLAWLFIAYASLLARHISENEPRHSTQSRRFTLPTRVIYFGRLCASYLTICLLITRSAVRARPGEPNKSRG